MPSRLRAHSIRTAIGRFRSRHHWRLPSISRGWWQAPPRHSERKIVPVPKRSPSLGKRAWRPSLSVVGVLLTVSSCGAPRMPTAEFNYTPIQSRAVHRDLNRELAAIAPNALSSRDLDTKRGGFSVGGMDLSIGLQI